jgi:hypothetical protein
VAGEGPLILCDLHVAQRVSCCRGRGQAYREVLDAVEVVVWDDDPVLPVARAADVGRVGQHGLEIVMAVTQGFEAEREPVGKRITARIALAGPRPL